jgi:arsenite transporter
VLALAAAPITGSPGLAILSGADPAPALRQLVLGTALLPLTVLPIFALMPVFADPGAALAAAAASSRSSRCRAAAGSCCAGDARARAAPRRPDDRRADDAPDGGRRRGPHVGGGTGARRGRGGALGDPRPGASRSTSGSSSRSGSRCAAGAGHGARARDRRRQPQPRALPHGAAAETVEALLLFVGCFQVPMYLTPLVMARLYRRNLRSA